MAYLDEDGLSHLIGKMKQTFVRTVNGVAPDEDGNIAVTVGDGGSSEPVTPTTADLIRTVWTNPQPDNDFIAQSIMLPELANADMVIIRYRPFLSTDPGDYNTIAMVGSTGTLHINTSNSNNRTGRRKFTVTSAKVAFEATEYNGATNNSFAVPLAIYALTLTGLGAIGVNQGTVETITKGLEVDLLWENGSPSSSFAAQHVILNTLGNYQLALIVASDYNTANFVTSMCIVGQGGVLMGANTSNNYNLTRRYTITKGEYVAGAADVSFEGGYYNGSAANARIVPLYIYGIK